MIALTVAASLAVVAVGLLTAAARTATVPARSAPIVVAEGDTVWAIARRAAPDADPVAVVERIVADNGLTSPVLVPGQVVSVPTGD